MVSSTKIGGVKKQGGGGGGGALAPWAPQNSPLRILFDCGNTRQAQLLSVRRYRELLINYKTTCSFDSDMYIHMTAGFFLHHAAERFHTSHSANSSTQELLIRAQLNVDGLYLH